MTQAAVVYRHNRNPHRGLAASGLLLVKLLLAVPHFFLVGLLGGAAFATAYVGYLAVALTGSLPMGLRDLMVIWLRWETRTLGWLAGITDEYPPFESEPPGYAVDLKTPANNNPSRSWALAGILFIKVLAIIPHLVALLFVGVAACFVTWAGYLVVLLTGRFPTRMQDYVAGATQWSVRVSAWLFGLTDEYPSFEAAVWPAAA
jgi:hypothetical protein